MIRMTLLAAVVVAASACRPTTAEVRCGKTLCNGNQRCEPKQLVCVLDEAPTLIIDEPRVGSLISGDTLTLSGTVRDDNGAPTLELSLDEGKTWLQVPLTGERFTARLALPALDHQPLGLSLRAHDTLQQATRHRVGVTVDNLAPLLTLASPIDGARLNAAWFAAVPKVSGFASDGSGIAALTVDVGDGPRAVTPVAGQFELDWAPPPGEDGVLRMLRVIAVDLAGNRTVIERAVTVDVVPPQLSFAVPAADALLGPAFILGGGVVQGLVSPGSLVTVDLGAGPRAARVAAGQWSTVYSPAPGLDHQPQFFEVVAADAAGNKTRAVRIVTVDVVPPVLTFTSPAAGARLNAANFTTGDDVTVGWSVVDGDPQVTVREGATPLAGASLKVATSALDNPKAYAVTLTAQDRAGNSSSAQLSFAVDRVRPTVTAQTPAAGTRNAQAVAAIEFSEDVTGGAGLALTPVATPGSWTSPKRYEVSGLAADAVFSAAAGAVSDGFGNPLVAVAPAKFHTAPAMPASGSTLMTDVFRFKVATDADGVMTLFTTSPSNPAGYRFARVNPKTGLVEDNRPAWAPMVGGNFAEIHVSSASSVNADLSAHRVSAATTLVAGGISERRSWVRVGEGAVTSELGMVGVIASRPFAGEPTGAGEVGLLKLVLGTVSYVRPGMSFEVPVGLNAPTAIGFATRHWELLEVRNQVFKRRSFGCFSTFSNSPPACELSAIEQWTDVAPADATSHAISDSCSVFAYDNTSGTRIMRVVPHPASCTGRACGSPWSLSGSQLAGLRLAAGRRDGNSFVGAVRTGASVQVLRMPLDADCQGAFVNVGAAVPVPAGADYEPVSLAGRPALVFVDSGNLLKVVVP